MAKPLKESQSSQPFELLFPEKQTGVTFCGVEIPKYGSLTPNEAIAISAIELSDGKKELFYFAEVAVIVLRSRCPNLRPYTAEELMDSPISGKELSALFDFIMGENRQWREEAAPEKKEEEIAIAETGLTPIGNSDLPTLGSLDSVALALETAQSI